MPSFHAFIILSRGAKDGLEAPSDSESESESDDEGTEEALWSTACGDCWTVGDCWTRNGLCGREEKELVNKWKALVEEL